MVDGVVAGSNIENIENKGDVKHPDHWWEMFQTADLIGVDEVESNHFQHPGKNGVLGRTIFMMYGGDKIITGFLPREMYETFFKINEGKVVLVSGKKPYILNGD